MTTQQSLASISREQTWHANIVRSCRYCGAPGTFHAVAGVNVGCYDPDRVGEPVGRICPCCKNNRPTDESKGVIHRKQYGVPVSWNLLGTLIRQLIMKQWQRRRKLP